VAFRDLPGDRKFAKYATIVVEVRKSRSDPRPESYTPAIDSLRVTQGPMPSGVAQERRDVILPLIQEDMCSIHAQQKVDGVSLGVFEPTELLEFRWERTAEEWPERKRMRIDQQSLLGDSKPPLEKIPFDFSYRYRCSTSGCGGHDQKIVDWEISEMFRTLRRGHDEGFALEKVRKKWADELWGGSTRDTYLYVGNQLAHPSGFLVLGPFGQRSTLQMMDPQAGFKANCFLSDDRTVARVGVPLEAQDAHPVDASEIDQEPDARRRPVPKLAPVSPLALREAAVLPEVSDLGRVAERAIPLVCDALLAERLEQGNRREPFLAGLRTFPHVD
jgi:hypothetical protein